MSKHEYLKKCLKANTNIKNFVKTDTLAAYNRIGEGRKAIAMLISVLRNVVILTLKLNNQFIMHMYKAIYSMVRRHRP